MTTVKCDETMAVILEDIWKLTCWGCQDVGHSLFTCPYLTPAQRIFFAYRHFRHQAESNPVVAKFYMKKAVHSAVTGSNPGLNPHPKSRASSQSPSFAKPYLRPVNYVTDFQPNPYFDDSSEETLTWKKEKERKTL